MQVVLEKKLGACLLDRNREELNTINVFRSMKRSINLLAQSETKKRLAPCQAVVIDRHFDFSNVSRECYKPIAI